LDITASQLPTTAAPGAGLATINPTTGIAYRALSGTWSAVTGTAGAEWTPTATTMAYAKYSRGYKSGGFNEGAISALPETNPEYIDAYEVGLKQQFGRQFQINAAAYYYNYQGFQIPLTVNTPGGASLTEFFNLQQVVSYGAELEGVWQATSQLQLLLSYSYLNATIRRGCCYVDGTDPLALQPGAHPSGPIIDGQQAQSVVGQTAPESPRNKIALNGNYQFDFEPGSLTLSASYIWTDQTYDSIFNRFYNLAPSYSQVDLRALWTDAANRYTVIVYAKNLFNAVGYDDAYGAQLTSPPAPNQTSVTRSYSYTVPRTFGVQLQYRFR
jgi:iron complex outermembrane recepter protein